TLSELTDEFGEEMATIVDGVTKIGKVSFTSREEAQAENIRKMFFAMAKDIRVILVKLADRLHNMRTLDYQNPIKKRLISQETLDIYSPLAHRLGLYRIKIELDDLSLKFLKPDIYYQIINEISQHPTLGQQYIDQVISMINQIMEKNSIQGRVNGRQKHIYSIYHKMQKQNLPISQVFDLIAFRVILNTVRDCYAMLGLIHAAWTPVPGRFKDYISMPKGNMYQSLHTTVVGPDGEHIEIQIRTEEMHQIAEYGVAAHWKYKDDSFSKTRDEDRFHWLRHILDWEQEMKDPREFMASLKIDLFQDEVYVFTPQGEIIDLPYGATPVDFAYMIHTEVGNQCSGAKVNGKLVPLQTQLKNGDSVEIITKKNHKPSRDWLKFVKTAKAKTRIKHWIRTEERDRSISLAKEILEKEGRKMNINFSNEINKGNLEAIAYEYSYKTVDDLLSAVGYAKITPKQLLNRLVPKAKGSQEKKIPASSKSEESRKKTSREEDEPSKNAHPEGVSVKGIDDLLIRFAQCCQPVPGDPIVGYISRGRGVIVHREDCVNVGQFSHNRLVNVSWSYQANNVYPATIKMLCQNKKGILAEISNLMAEEDVNIESGEFRSDVDGKTEVVMHIEVNDSTHLYKTLDKLSQLTSVYEAIRLSNK
ncbi:MAG TPA: bifunctional (p)ppGpp synthetase/guanosine-3',5'-bis(diphosphate) 3'-pyrophosphohydrolase, partial [Desulfohalobiaceae bacterium]|nr:bifunctional (p)ppGpp synthetase/guanosine-3',5'-bis(diphosphate) 3'-pyrophosphohydrolase [Desulfohalobiaceae bacterium]